MPGTRLRDPDDRPSSPARRGPDQRHVGAADLEEQRPPRSVRCASGQSEGRRAPEHFFKPPGPNHVWHLDLTVLRVLWLRFEIAAILDGFSRKIIAIKLFKASPTTPQMVALIDEVSRSTGGPRYLVTDRGGQFQKSFRHELGRRGIEHARGRAQTWQFNAKVERLFWSMKRWWRVSLIIPNTEAIQKRLNAYATWHNRFRPHAALGWLTPHEAALGASPPAPLRYTEGGDIQPEIKVKRKNVRGDPRLLYPVIEVTPKIRSVA
ncbi:MAG: DDE-type integrase/transposase/recombinase [Phycisphaeraceae bacterium]